MSENKAWIRLIPMELDAIEEKDFIEPKNVIGEGDTEIGPMSLEAKRLWTLSQHYAKASAEARIEETFGDSEAADHTKSNRLAGYAAEIRDIMWTVIKDDHELWDKPFTIGITRSFKVISSPSKSLPSFLRGLGGSLGQD
ncbi:MAG: hypothetical protein V1742_09145 [Pseudomonadota bacterium]